LDAKDFKSGQWGAAENRVSDLGTRSALMVLLGIPVRELSLSARHRKTGIIFADVLMGQDDKQLLGFNIPWTS